MRLTTAKLEINNARLAARITAGTIGGPPVPAVILAASLALFISSLAVVRRMLR